MLKKVLVSELISEGQLLLDALKRNRFPFSDAVWLSLEDWGEWRLVIVTPSVDRSGPLAVYARIQRILAHLNVSQLDLTDITVIGPASDDFQDLRAHIANGGRFTDNSAVGSARNVVFEDHYVYQT